MKFQTNIGMVNALIRITIGLTVLAWCTANLVKKPWRDSYLFMALCGAMKVAEGIVRFCPITALFENGQNIMSELKQQGNECCHNSENHPYNPS